jgi:hypothetical protein
MLFTNVKNFIDDKSLIPQDFLLTGGNAVWHDQGSVSGSSPEEGAMSRYRPGQSLHIRPTPPEVRLALRQLARQADMPFYEYVLHVLKMHIHQEVRRQLGTPDPDDASAQVHTSA